MLAAVYAGSFDPVTNGHLWVIETASRIFGNLTVLVANNPSKKSSDSMFTPHERVKLIELSIGSKQLRDSKNINVDILLNDEFLVDRMVQEQYDILIRGIRDVDDARQEQMLLYVNRQINSQIETVFLMPPEEISKVSSSMVKKIIGPKNWPLIVAKYVPSPVVDALIEKVGYNNEEYR